MRPYYVLQQLRLLPLAWHVRRSGGGQFRESDDVGRSLPSDRRTKAKTKAPKGQGDRGDR